MDAQSAKSLRAKLRRSRRDSPSSPDDVTSAESSIRLMRNLIHDINNCLMLILITSEKIEEHQLACASSERLCEPSPAYQSISTIEGDEASLAIRERGQIIKNNAIALREMMQSLQQLMLETDHKERLSPATTKWTITELWSFLERQLPQWQLLLPPHSDLHLQLMPCEEGLIELNPPALIRSLQNIIRNASEAFIKSEALIKTDTDVALVITISGCPQAGYFTLSVQDNGPGIADDVRDDLFHEAVTTKAMSALVQGQGLVSAQDCLATFGGQLKLHHTDHQGSIFHLALPWHKQG